MAKLIGIDKPTLKVGERAEIEFRPDAAAVNPLIAEINDMLRRVTPQEYATSLASYIAAIAFVMRGANDLETVKAIFNTVIDDANRQYEAREKALLPQ